MITLGWAGATLCFTVVRAASSFGQGRPSFEYLLYTNAVQYALWALTFPLLANCVQRFPLDQGTRLHNGFALSVIAMVLAVYASLGHLAIMFWTYFKPINHSLFPTFTSMLETQLWRIIPLNLLIAILLTIMLQGWRVWQNLQIERMRSMELERQLAVSHLESLRMQLHPHFLFNTLHTIASLITEQPATARRMVAALGDFLRRTLRDATASFRSLAEELEFADLYMSIEKLRLGDRLILNYDMEPEATSAEVPYLLLQPLFENAVRHGAARIIGPCGISFHARREGQRLNVRLENDGPPVHQESMGPPTHGVGLENTTARLRLHYGNNFTFQYTNRPQGGVRIDISLPYRKAGNDEELYAGATSSHSHAHR